MVKVIIAGGREYADYYMVRVKLNNILSSIREEIEIVSGACNTGKLTFTRDDGTMVCGADGLGEKYAKEKGYPVKYFPADWDTYGKPAGAIRNEEMAKYATHCVCFWDGESTGTKSMIDFAKQYKLKLREVMYQKPVKKK